MNKTRISILLSLSIILSIIISVGGMVLNFEEFMFGRGANIKNLVVTFLYISTWTAVLIMAIKGKSRVALMYCLIYWILASVSALGTAYVNITDSLAGWATLIYALFFAGQFYGVNYLTNSYLISSITIATISLSMVAVAAVLYGKLLRDER